MLRMADVELTSVDWLWFPYIPFGKLTIIQGNPGEGKTYFAMRLAAACTNRKPLSLIHISKYKAEHETELKQFYAARRKLTGEFPDGKVNMKKLTEEYDELEQAHETTYGEFKTVRDDLHRLWKVKSCVDTATRFNERTEEQMLQNRPQTRQKKEDMTR